MESKFFHVYVHQMLIEGCFNIIDHNQKGASAELKTAALNMKVLPRHLHKIELQWPLMLACLQVNKNGGVDVEQTAIHSQVKASREVVTDHNKNTELRKSEVLHLVQSKK